LCLSQNLGFARGPWKSVSFHPVKTQKNQNHKSHGSLLVCFYFLFLRSLGESAPSRFHPKQRIVLLTFIHFLSTAFLSGFIKGIILHSESFSSL
jgi:hypothetical protein